MSGGGEGLLTQLTNSAFSCTHLSSFSPKRLEVKYSRRLWNRIRVSYFEKSRKFLENTQLQSRPGFLQKSELSLKPELSLTASDLADCFLAGS